MIVWGTQDDDYTQGQLAIGGIEYGEGKGATLGFVIQRNANLQSSLSGGAIRLAKENATAGNYATEMGFYTRAHGADVVKQLSISSAGNATFSGAVTIAAGGGNFILQPAQNMYFDGGNHTRITESSNDVLDFYAGTTNTLRLTTSGATVTGTIVATADITAFSDIRLKKNINTIDSALDKVVKMLNQ